ncbi:MAG TPA: MarC family protein [Candidatus Acidoferrales bacterium]|nr:MarC family protein [Candidatus Acidoferrales bacterium]
MLEVVKSTLLIISALLPIVNPLSSTPIFLLLTRDYDSSTRMRLAWRIAFNSFFLLIVSLLVGTHILSFFDISLPVVQVGGGLVVISTGWMMLNRRDDEGEKGSSHHAVDRSDILSNAFYPLTLPLTVGPGSISVAITLGANAPHQHGFDLFSFIAALVGSLIVSITVFLCYGSAERIARLVGPTGMSVILRLSSFLLVCIGVQILWNGASVLLASVPVHAP